VKFSNEKLADVAMIVALHAMWTGIATTFYVAVTDNHDAWWIWVRVMLILAVIIYLMTPSDTTEDN
jgi:hypothetical protein